MNKNDNYKKYKSMYRQYRMGRLVKPDIDVLTHIPNKATKNSHQNPLRHTVSE